MLKKTAVEHFGGVVKLAKALHIKPPSVSEWGVIIPEQKALRLEKITKGQLVYNEIFYRNDNAA
jgi:DNA-binding transcriptional regulator YdaS (Cro superfamily)